MIMQLQKDSYFIPVYTTSKNSSFDSLFQILYFIFLKIQNNNNELPLSIEIKRFKVCKRLQ